MARMSFAIVLACAVMMVASSTGLAIVSAHKVVKGDKGPNMSAISWDFQPPYYGTWTAHIVNDGLKWITVNVYDNTTGVLEEIMHERIRFAAYDAYPSGSVDTQRLIVSPTHRYAVTAIPNGPKGASCTIDDSFYTPPPIPVFTYAVDHLSVTVDASASYDPDGTIVEYRWDFGDGTTGTGIIATHMYQAPATYNITLKVTDNRGASATTSQIVNIIDLAPAASPICTKNGLTVSVGDPYPHFSH